MKRPIKPAQGWPWEQPGFVWFSPEMKAFLGGYTPRLADESLLTRGEVAKAHSARIGREKSAEAMTGWGKGTIPGLADTRVKLDVPLWISRKKT